MCLFIWMYACVNRCVSYLLQGGMKNVVLGRLTRLMTTATCLTTCQEGRGQKLEPTASTRVETSSVSLIPLNRRLYKVGFLHLFFTLLIFFIIILLMAYLCLLKYAFNMTDIWQNLIINNKLELFRGKY